MPGVGIVNLTLFKIRHEIKRGREQRCARLPQNGAKVGIDSCQQLPRVRARSERNSSTNPRTIAVTRAERTPCPMTSQIKSPAFVSESACTLKKSPPTWPGGMILVAEMQQARFLRRGGRKRRILLGKDGVLDVPRHFQVFFKNIVLFAATQTGCGPVPRSPSARAPRLVCARSRPGTRSTSKIAPPQPPRANWTTPHRQLCRCSK